MPRSPSPRFIELQQPFLGLDKKRLFQNQAPYSTPSCLNVRPSDQIKRRRRIGSRPGLGKSHVSLLGSGNPVRMLNNVSYVSTNGKTQWCDYFDSTTLNGIWAYTFGTAPSITDSNLSGLTYANSGGVLRTSDITGMNTSAEYVLEVFVIPQGGTHNGIYRIFFGTAASTNPFTTGCMAELYLNDSTGTFSGSLKRYSASAVAESYLFTSGSTGSAKPGWFRVVVNGTTISCTWQENALITNQALSSLPGAKFGFGMEATVTGGVCLVDTFRCEYTPNDGSSTYRKLVTASANGSLYYENYNNTFSTAGGCTLASDRNLQSAERLQKLYIADNGASKASGTNGVITSGRLDSASYADWSALSISTTDDVVEISSLSGATLGITAGTYSISNLHATNGLLLAGDGGTALTGNVTTCRFRVLRGVKVFDPSTGNTSLITQKFGPNFVSGADESTLGAMPVGCTMAAVYRDRLVLAGDPNAPHAFFASRAGDVQDYVYSTDKADSARAVGGTQIVEGAISEPITALIPVDAEYLVFGCLNQIHVLRGDWATGGAVETVSREIGIVGRYAHCRTPSGDLCFLSRDGLYIMPASGGIPEPVSRLKLPDELLRLDSSVFEIALAYDVEERGIHISITAKETGTDQYSYFFDWEDKGFWPQTTASAYQAFTMLSYAGTAAGDSCVLRGCRDGYVRREYRYAERDEDTAFSSHVSIGPIRLGDGYADGIWNEIEASIATGSGDVGWALYTGEQAEGAAVATTAFASGTWGTAASNYREHPRMRGMYGLAKISNGETGRWWALEWLKGVTIPGGPFRK